jgi:hypothetical protein
MGAKSLVGRRAGLFASTSDLFFSDLHPNQLLTILASSSFVLERTRRWPPSFSSSVGCSGSPSPSFWLSNTWEDESKGFPAVEVPAVLIEGAEGPIAERDFQTRSINRSARSRHLIPDKKSYYFSIFDVWFPGYGSDMEPVSAGKEVTVTGLSTRHKFGKG